MRNATPALIALWESGSFGIEVDVLIEVPTSPTETALRSYRSYLGENWIAGLDFSESIDQTITAGTLVLIREHGDYSLAPLMEASVPNGYGTGFYAPAIDSGREIEIRVALVPQVQTATAPTGAPAASTALTVSPLPCAAPKGATVLLGGSVATWLTEPAAKSATFLSIAALPSDVAAGASVRVNAALPDATYNPAVTIYDVGNWIPVLLGITDKPDWGGKANEIKVNFRNRLGVLADKQILDAFDVGLPEVLTPVEDVIQQIINAKAPGTFDSVVPLPSSPGFDIRYGPVEPQLVFEAIESLLAQYGGRVQYKQPAGYGDYELCIVLPPDEAGDPQYTIAPTQYIDLPAVDLDPSQRRTVIRVAYMDKETGALSYYQHPPEELVESDPIVRKYGDFRTQLAFGAAHAIDTEAEARTLAEKAHAALSTVPLAQEVECFTAPWVELDDIVTLPANGFHYDTDQIGAVTGISWSFPRGGGGRMRIRCSEKPLGGFRRYQQMDAQIYGFNASQREPVPSVPLPALESFGPKEKTALGVTPSWTRSLLPPVAQVWVYSFEVDVPFAVKPAPDETTARTAVLVTENEYFIAYPPKGKEKFVYFVPVTSVGTIGLAQVSHVLPASGLPLVSFNSVQGSSELYSDVQITVEDPQNLGGSLKVWLNRDEPGDASAAGSHEAIVTLAETPGSVGAGALFLTVPGGALEAVLDDVRTHPNLGKNIYAEFVNTLGVSSGVQKGYLKGWGTIVDGSGNLKPGAVNTGNQIANEVLSTTHFLSDVAPIRVLEGTTLPLSGLRDGDMVTLRGENPRRVYMWEAAFSAWRNIGTAASAIIGQLQVGQLAAGSVRATEMAADLAIFRKLVISDLQNLADEHGSFKTITTAGWAGTGLPYLYVIPGTGYVNAKYAGAYAPGGAAVSLEATKVVEVQVGDSYYVGMAANVNDANFALSLNTYFYSAAGAVVGSTLLPFSTTAGTQRLGTQVTAPAGTATMQVFIEGTGSGTWVFSELAVRKATEGRLLVDGSVSVPKIYLEQMGNSESSPTALIRLRASNPIPGTVVTLLDLAATGTEPVLLHPSLSLTADGGGSFAGIVSANSFTASLATFSGTVRASVFAMIGTIGADPASASLTVAGFEGENGFGVSIDGGTSQTFLADDAGDVIVRNDLRIGKGSGTVSSEITATADVPTNQTSYVLVANEGGSPAQRHAYRVKMGANGSGPGGIGRALYIDDY